VDALRKAAAIAWSGRRRRRGEAAGKVHDDKNIADLIAAS